MQVDAIDAQRIGVNDHIGPKTRIGAGAEFDLPLFDHFMPAQNHSTFAEFVDLVMFKIFFDQIRGIGPNFLHTNYILIPKSFEEGFHFCQLFCLPVGLAIIGLEGIADVKTNH